MEGWAIVARCHISHMLVFLELFKVAYLSSEYGETQAASDLVEDFYANVRAIKSCRSILS